MPFDIGQLGQDAAGGIIGQGLGMIFGGMQDKRQLRQQEKLQSLQLQGNKSMAQFNQDLQFDLWNKTNYEAQMKHLKNAGLNPALLYGGGGGGGATTGGGGGGSVSGATATDPSAATAAGTQMGMMLANMKLMDAQAEKTKAETEKIEGVDTTESTARIRETGARATSQEFETGIRQEMAEDLKMQINLDRQIKGIEASREAGAWEAYQAAGFKGKAFDDPNTPIAKALTAGWDNAVTQAENAKKDGNIKAAQTTIEQFKANLAKQGIAPDSPWGVKLVADLLEKIGLNPLKMIGGK